MSALRQRHIRPVILVPPWPRDELVRSQFSKAGLDALDLSYSYTRRWCHERGLPIIEVPDSRAFDSNDWDDFQHLRTSRAYERLAAALKDWLLTNGAQDRR